LITSSAAAAAIGTGAFLIAVLGASLVVEVVKGSVETGPDRAMGTLLVLSYAAAFSMLLDVLLAPGAPHGIEWVLLVVLAAKSADIGGFLAGKAIGGPKLAPAVSPNKTRAGSAGGTILSVAVAVVGGGMLTEPLPMVDRIVLGLVLTVTSQFGDLAESLLKRWLRVKDSGALIPTFGGTLDMIDSLVLAAPAGYWYLVLRGHLAI